MLLTADWHLTAKPEDEYRWDVFRRLSALTNDSVEILILGDITDHKTDKHPAALVNRLVDELLTLSAKSARVTILMGNHDAPLNGVPFWSFLNDLSGIRYLSEPTPWHDGDSYMLPFSKAPNWEWKNLNFSKRKAVFMHQPVAGVDLGNGRRYSTETVIAFPRSCRVYSGDIHMPQTLGNITYVGAPHWVRFGDTHARRFLEVSDQTFKVEREIPIEDGARKLIANVVSVAELSALRVNPGDQVRVRLGLSEGDVSQVPALTAQIREWAEAHKVVLVSTETSLEGGARYDVSGTFLNDVGQIFQAFAQYEGIAADFYESGAALCNTAVPTVKVPPYA